MKKNNCFTKMNTTSEPYTVYGYQCVPMEMGVWDGEVTSDATQCVLDAFQEEGVQKILMVRLSAENPMLVDAGCHTWKEVVEDEGFMWEVISLLEEKSEKIPEDLDELLEILNRTDHDLLVLKNVQESDGTVDTLYYALKNTKIEEVMSMPLLWYEAC